SEDRYAEREGGILPEPQLVLIDDLDLDSRYDDDNEDDSGGDGDGDGLDDTVDADDHRDGSDDARDAHDDDASAAAGRAECGAAAGCVGTLCMPASFTNLPVRRYWRQKHVDE